MIEKINLDDALNGSTPASDAEYVYAEAANGLRVKIKKSDFASITGGLLGINHFSRSFQIGEIAEYAFYCGFATLTAGWGRNMIVSVTRASVKSVIVQGEMSAIKDNPGTLNIYRSTKDGYIEIQNNLSVIISVSAAFIS